MIHGSAPWDIECPKEFGIILADPPWRYRDKRSGRGGCEAHYPTMSDQEILDLPVSRIAADDCALFLWVTGPRLPLGLRVLESWGFEYRTTAFTWIKRGDSGKLAWGNGSWTRANPEFCLLGVRGKPQRLSAAIHSVIEAPRTKHSQKPDETHERIEDLLGDHVPRIELFARRWVPGWEAWGSQL